MTNILLDTHVLIWSLTKSEELSTELKEIIQTAKTNKTLYLSSISLWEIAMLAHKQRISIFRRITDFLEKIENIKGLNIMPITGNIAAESVMLSGELHYDPADRIIVATAKCYGATLVTRDQKILTWASLGHIKSLSA